jgi:cation diffusion facilitator CzcD-associated flavoprotein CzcO
MDGRSANTYTHVKSLAIVGAGVAGLQLAERLKSSGLRVTIFEATHRVGGVWSSNYGASCSPTCGLTR